MRMKTHLSYVPRPLPVTPKRPKKPGIGPIMRRVLTVRGGPYNNRKVLFAHEGGRVQSIVFRVGDQRGRYIAGPACDVAQWEENNG